MDPQNLPADLGWLGRLCRAALGVLAAFLIVVGLIYGMGLVAFVHLGLAIVWFISIVPSKNIAEARTDLVMALTTIFLSLSPFGIVLLPLTALYALRERRVGSTSRLHVWIGFMVAALFIWEGMYLEPLGQWFLSRGASDDSVQAMVLMASALIQAPFFAAIAISASKLVSREKWWFAFGWGTVLASMGDVRSSLIARDQTRLIGIAIDFVVIGLALIIWYRNKGSYGSFTGNGE
jgi:uncharacterized membrane protein